MTLGKIPCGLDEIILKYGNPDIDHNFLLDDWFVADRTGIFHLPFEMRLSWRPKQKVNKIRAHIEVGPVMIDALKEILMYRGYTYLEDNQYDWYGGCFNFRLKRGGNKLSAHSWGIAIDINPQIAPFGKPGKQPEFIIKAFERRGFEWGGRWKYPDPMHFQACTCY